MPLTQKPFYTHRSCYVNFAEHLQNSWNVNMLYPQAPNRWGLEDWRQFLTMIKAFGYNCFEYWIPPTMFQEAALTGEGRYGMFADTMRRVTELAHELGLKTKAGAIPNCLGADWYFACPNDKADHERIMKLWSHWCQQLSGTDIITIFPGDPGGCNRNGCDHETFIELALNLTEVTRKYLPDCGFELNTWGTPFSGWGSDLRHTPHWDGSWAMLTSSDHDTPETPCHIWNGDPERAERAMSYLLRRLPEFPQETMVAINLGFSPDCDMSMGGDARGYARAIAAIRPIVTWDYSLCEGELINYPHWRLPRMAARRREERSAAPYSGGMCYTMTPKLNLLSLYAGGQLLINPDADPDQLSRQFCADVFGAEHAELGELFEAFEVVQGWGHYPRHQWSKQQLRLKYPQIIDRLEAVKSSSGCLPIYPAFEHYRSDLLWFARKFLTMAGDKPNRAQIEQEYWQRALNIYDVIEMSADPRAHLAAQNFSSILA
ncbi:MAG: hypothetical protein ACYC1M_07085 [Armatimonadota bacterium]